MIDTIGALNRSKARLVEWKRSINEEASRKIAEIDQKIADIDKAIDIANEAIKDILCPKCGGKGSVRSSDAAGQMEDVTCYVCKGTGIKM